MKRSSAFTLVEVVLAIAIGALLLLAVYGVLAAAERTRTTIDHQTRAGRAATAVFNQLRADLAAATIYRDQEITFLCDRDATSPAAPQRLDFLTLAPPRAMPEVDGEALRIAPTEVGYQLRRDGAYYTLMRREQVYRDSAPTEGGLLEPMVGGVGLFSLRFHDGQGWSDRWVDRKRLPRAVSVEIALWAGDGPPPAKRSPHLEVRFSARIEIRGRGLVLDQGKGDGSGSGG